MKIKLHSSCNSKNGIKYRRLFVLILFHILTFNAFSQQIPSIEKYLPVDIITSENIFFKRQAINPSLSYDSIKFKANWIIESIAGSGIPSSAISLTGKIPKIKSNIGVYFNYSESNVFKNQKLRINYSSKFILNQKSDIKAGINIGLSRNKFDNSQFYIPGFYESVSNWHYSPNLDIGFTYRRLNQNIGFSYIDMITSYMKTDFSKYKISERILLVNYFSSYCLTKSLKISPEIIVFNNTHRTDLLFKGIISFKDKLLTGAMVDNTLKNYRFMLSLVILKHFELGYVIEFNDRARYNNYGTQSLKFGFYVD